MATLGSECGAVICWFGYIFFLLCNVAITARGIHLLAPLDHSMMMPSHLIPRWLRYAYLDGLRARQE